MTTKTTNNDTNQDRAGEALIKCSRCKGKGWVDSHVQQGVCFKCNGTTTVPNRKMARRLKIEAKIKQIEGIKGLIAEREADNAAKVARGRKPHPAAHMLEWWAEDIKKCEAELAAMRGK